MTVRNRIMRWVLPVAILSVPVPASAQDGGDGTIPSTVDINALIEETQIVSDNPDLMDLVWWLPPVFWAASLAGDQTTGADELEEIENVVAPYTMVAASQGRIGPFGGVAWLEPDVLRSTIVLIDSRGVEYKPLADTDVSPDARNLTAMMSPILASVAGPIGANLNFFFFPATDQSGRMIADPASTGSLSIRIASETYDWQLPLGSVLPPKECPVDQVRMKGNWDYCPYHGDKLVFIDQR